MRASALKRTVRRFARGLAVTGLARVVAIASDPRHRMSADGRAAHQIEEVDPAGVHDDLTLSLAKDIVYTHHEKWDGTGYPEGLHGTEIPIPGRIMALVDVYDAVHTRRLYGAPLSHNDTIALIQKGSGTHFDPAVVEAFLAVADTLRALPEDEDPASESSRANALVSGVGA